MTGKRSCIDLDPDYEDISEQQAKRQRVLEQDAKQASLKKIENIIQSHFEMETENIESDVIMIDQLLNQARTTMDRLRAVAVASYYSRLQQNPGKVLHLSFGPVNAIHPTVKKYLGKAPMGTQIKTEPATSPSEGGTDLSKKCTSGQSASHQLSACSGQKMSQEQISTSTSADEIKGSRFTKRIIAVGNVSKYITDREREINDHSTHKWMVYVRGPREDPSIHSFVSKVWFFLHPSYRPNDRVEISTPPFHLTRRGWGEFPVRVQLHFWDERNKRVDIIHNLKLDRTYTGLQTLGAETVVEIELLQELPGNINSQKCDHRLLSKTGLRAGTIGKNEEEKAMMGCCDKDVSVAIVNDKLTDKCLPLTVSENLVTGTTNRLQEVTPASQEVAGVTVKQEPAELSTGSQSEHLKSSLSHEAHLTGNGSEGKCVATNRLENPETVVPITAARGAKAVSCERSTKEEANDRLLYKPQHAVGHFSASTESSSLPSGILSTQGEYHLDSVEVCCGETNPKTLSSSSLANKPALVLSSNSCSLSFQRFSQSSVIVVSTPPKAQLVPTENSASTNVRMVSLLQRPLSVITPSSVCAPPRAVGTTKQPVLATSAVAVSQHHTNSNPPDANPPKVLMQVTPMGLKAVNTAKPISASTTCTSLLTPKEIVVSRPPSISKLSQSLLPSEPRQHMVLVRPSATRCPLPRQQIVIVRPPVMATSSPQQVVLKMPVTHVPSKAKNLSSGTPVNKVSLLTSPMSVPTSVKLASSLPATAPRTVSLLKPNGPTQNHSKLSDPSSSVSGVVATSSASLTPASSSSPKVTLVLPKTNNKPLLVNLDVSKLKAQGITLDTFLVNKAPVSSSFVSHNKVAHSTNTPRVVLVPPTQATGINAISHSKVANSSFSSSHLLEQSSTFSVLAALARLKEANEVKEHADCQCSLPRTRRWFLQDHSLMSSSPQSSVSGDGTVAVASCSAAEAQVQITHETEGMDKQCVEAEKRILAWKDKKQRSPEFLTTPQEQPVSYLSLEDYADLTTLIRAAVLKHPLIDSEAEKFSRPYCAQSWQQWVSWNVGKQRAAEWTRAAIVRKYLKHQLGKEGKFKGKQLWSTCQIMQWCRLHGQSPHNPGGQIVSPQTCEWEAGENEKREEDILGMKFSSLSSPTSLVSKDVVEAPDSDKEEESEIEVVFADPPKLKVKIEKAEEEGQFKAEIFPPSEEAMFVQETAAKIGVRFLPAELLPEVMTHTSEDMIYAAMLEFANELLNEAFASCVASDKPLQAVTVPDVYQALVHMPSAPLFTNQHLASHEEMTSCSR